MNAVLLKLAKIARKVSGKTLYWVHDSDSILHQVAKYCCWGTDLILIVSSIIEEVWFASVTILYLNTIDLLSRYISSSQSANFLIFSGSSILPIASIHLSFGRSTSSPFSFSTSHLIPILARNTVRYSFLAFDSGLQWKVKWISSSTAPQSQTWQRRFSSANPLYLPVSNLIWKCWKFGKTK